MLYNTLAGEIRNVWALGTLLAGFPKRGVPIELAGY
jgi:hypothetical protein